MTEIDKPNILFIVIDSLKADKIYGENKTSKTPNIDKMIKHGVLFTKTVSPAASTGISLGSIFTGLFPFKTGLSSKNYEKISHTVPNYISFLKNNSYSTYATMSSINNLLGITTDFDLQIDLNRHNNYLGLYDGLGEKLSKKFESNKLKDPWIFYIHLYDLHQPNIVPKKFDNEEFGITQYDRMLSSIDKWVGEFLDRIDIKKTLVVLTADHGDYIRSIVRDGKEINLESGSFEKFMWELGNKFPPSFQSPKRIASKVFHSYRSKSREQKIKDLELTQYEKRTLGMSRAITGTHLHDDILLVPLIFFGLGITGKIIRQQVPNIDIFPTILEIIGFEYGHKTDGVSLVPLMKGETVEDQPCYIESMPTIKKESDKIIGIRTSKFKYTRSKDDSSKIELYDLVADPLEEKNIATDKPEVVFEMEKILKNILKDSIETKTQMNPEKRKKVEEQLKKMGYI